MKSKLKPKRDLSKKRNLAYEPRFEAEFGEVDGKICVTSPDPITVEDALAIANVDQDIWEVSKVRVGGHQVSMKMHKGPAMEDPLQVWNNVWTVWVRRRVAKSLSDAFLLFEKRLAKHAPKHKGRSKYPVTKEKHMLEVCLLDEHWGKLAWRRESMQDQDLKIAENIYANAMDDLLKITSPFPVEKILFPFGHDFFHVNDATFTTPKAHNNLDVDGRLPKIFETGGMAVIKGIEKCLEVAPVEVVLVKGNHDQDLSYFLATVLKAYFRHNKNVTVDSESISRKYRRYGNVLLGMTHIAGRGLKPERLGGIMAKEAKADFAATTHHEWHVAHKHRAFQYDTNAVAEELGFRVRTLPCLTATDKWHFEEGWVGNYRAAEAYLWHKERCYVGHFNAYVREGGKK